VPGEVKFRYIAEAIAQYYKKEDIVS